jgi:small subunit ribosomal protein S6
MKEYELTVLIHPDLEVDIDAPLAKVRDIVKNAGGTITTEENWGKKKLAYRIKKQDFGVYVYMQVALPADAPLKISNTFNITEELLRYLLVLVDEKGRAALAEQELSAKSRVGRDDDTRESKEEE